MDTHKYNRFNGIFLLIQGAASVLSFMACEQGENIRLGNDDTGMGVEIVDTLTIEASTFLLDPLPTAGTGSMLVGNLTDETLGSATLSSCFRIGNGELNLADLPADAAFDSLSLRLFYDHYYYGDTTARMHLALYRLSEEMELSELPVALEDDEYPVFVQGETLWSDQRFAVDEVPVGEVTFLPRPLSTSDTVKIRLDDALGQTLFTMALNNDTRLTNAEDFIDYIKGFLLVPEGEGKCIVGLQDSLALNLHYSYERQSDGMRVSDTLRFTMGATEYQYNQVAADRRGTVLEQLAYEHEEVPASATGYRTFIQGSSGVVTRLRFPTARQFINSANIGVSKAQLIIETDQPADGLFTPPQALVMMVANQYGTPTSLLTASYQDGIQSAFYQAPSQTGGAGNGKYTFDLTEYISEMRNGPASETESLLLTIPTEDLMSTVNRLSIAAQGHKPAIKLHILYTKF